MATSAFLNGEVAEFTVLVDGDVMHEFIVLQGSPLAETFLETLL